MLCCIQADFASQECKDAFFAMKLQEGGEEKDGDEEEEEEIVDEAEMEKIADYDYRDEEKDAASQDAPPG